MPGAGKGAFSEEAVSKGIPVYVCGDVIREEAKKRGLPINRESLGKLMFELRELEGPSVVVKRLEHKLMVDKSQLLVVEGVRSLAEVEELRRKFHVILCAVHASPKLRFQRIISRRRSDDPLSWDAFKSRDTKELKVGLGNVIALADRMTLNESSLEEFKTEARKILGELDNL